MNEPMNKQTSLIAGMALALAACGAKETGQRLIHSKDSICIGASFYVVGDVTSYPWIKLDPNLRCSERDNLPSTYVNFDKVDSFQPNCVCRYSAACRKRCDDETCLEACTD